MKVTQITVEISKQDLDGNGVLEIGNKVWACDRGLELKATIESIKKEIGLQSC